MSEEPKFRSRSYAACHCGAHCWLGGESTEERPCWGGVMCVHETEEGCLHSCKGHTDIWGLMPVDEKYQEEP